jgi:hypothetical protein
VDRFLADYEPAVKIFRIALRSVDLGQLLDGLGIREQSWRNTAVYLRDDYFPDDTFMPEVCRDPDEAEKIAKHYERIIRSIEQQIDQQGGW